ncbi:MAG: VanZ family protein [Candidatus Binataceae bacterium]
MRVKWPSRLCLFIAVVAIVYWLGTSLFSAARMEPLFYPLFRSVFHADTDGQLFQYLSFVRWSAHYAEYFILFLALVWLVGLRPLTALTVCLLLAVADEGHQYFLPDRTFSLHDIKLDAAGAITAFILIFLGRRGIRRRPQIDPQSPRHLPSP